MNTKNSTLELFALRSYVSVLPETEKETALKIVGGGDPPDGPCDPYEGRDLNIYDCDAWDCIEWLLDDYNYIEVDDDGNIIDYQLGPFPDDDGNYFDYDSFQDWQEENPCDYS